MDVNLSAHPRPPLRKRADSLLWEVYRDALIAVTLWLALVGLALFALSATTARARPTVAPSARVSAVATPCVSGAGSADPQDPDAHHLNRPKLRPRSTSQSSFARKNETSVEGVQRAA